MWLHCSRDSCGAELGWEVGLKTQCMVCWRAVGLAQGSQGAVYHALDSGR